MHFIQTPQHIVVKLVQLRRKNAISGRWLSQVHTQNNSCLTPFMPPVMPRQVQIEYAGAFYHVMGKGNRRGDIIFYHEERKTF